MLVLSCCIATSDITPSPVPPSHSKANSKRCSVAEIDLEVRKRKKPRTPGILTGSQLSFKAARASGQGGIGGQGRNGGTGIAGGIPPNHRMEQSMQSVPKAHKDHVLPGPPSSHVPSEDQRQVCVQSPPEHQPHWTGQAVLTLDNGYRLHTGLSCSHVAALPSAIRSPVTFASEQAAIAKLPRPQKSRRANTWDRMLRAGRLGTMRGPGKVGRPFFSRTASA